MPPTGKPYRMTNAWDAQPARHGHRIVLRGPNSPFRNRILKTEPLRAGRAVPSPIKPRVIGQDLNPRANDEHHEEHVQEVLQLQPPRKPGIDRGRELRDTRVILDEGLDAWKFSQALRESNQENESHGSDWQRPQDADPATSYADAGNNPLLRRQPLAHDDTIVRRAQSRRDGIVWQTFDLHRVRHTLRSPRDL